MYSKQFIIFLALLGVMPLSAMQNQPSIARKCFSRAMTSLKLGLEFGLIGWELYENHQDLQKRKDKLEKGKYLDEMPPITSFVREELKKNNVPNADEVEVRFRWEEHPYGGISKVGDKWVAVVCGDCILAADPNAPVEKHAKWKALYGGILGHEAQHLINNDQQKRTIFAAVSPFITAAATKAMGLAPYAFLPKAYGRFAQFAHKTFLNDLTKPIRGCFNYLASKLSQMAYIRHQEQRADDGILDNPEYLKNLAHHFYDSHQRDIKYIMKERNMDERQADAYLYLNSFFQSHPYMPHRIAKLEERAKKLEEASK
jgi:hypothetical protein